jgi:hypothetical protein
MRYVEYNEQFQNICSVVYGLWAVPTLRYSATVMLCALCVSAVNNNLIIYRINLILTIAFFSLLFPHGSAL